MTDTANPDQQAAAEERVTVLERQLAEMETVHQAALLRAGLKAEAVRAGMIDLDGLKLVDASGVHLDEHGDVVGATQLMATLKRTKPWLFGLAGGTSGAFTSSVASAPPAQAPKARRAQDMTYEEWQAARAELLRRL